MSETVRFPIRLRGDGAASDAACAVVLVRCAETQLHMGLRRAVEPHEPVLHLAWHRRLLDQALEQVARTAGRALPAAVIVLSLDPLVDEALQILARRVARRHANAASAIAYGFGEPSGLFDARTGELTDPDAAFTCATLVLALLRSVGVHLLDSTRWREPTAEDLEWQRRTGRALLAWIEERIHGDLPRATERVGRDIGSRRYRPSDVAGASLFGPDRWPVGAEEVGPRAQELETALVWRVSSA